MSEPREWLERLDEGLVWDGGPFLAAPVQHEPVVVVDRAGELGQQPCLADSGLARDKCDAALAGAHARERLVQTGDRRLAAREGATANDLQALRERHDPRIGVACRALPPQLRRQLAGRRRGRDPKLPHQPPREVGIRAQRTRTISGRIEREHQLSLSRFVQRLPRRQATRPEQRGA